MEVSGQLHALAALFPVPIVQEAGWAEDYPEGCTPEDAVLRTTPKSSNASAKRFTQHAYSVPRKRGKSVLITKEALRREKLNFVKGVPMMCVNFVIV